MTDKAGNQIVQDAVRKLAETIARRCSDIFGGSIQTKDFDYAIEAELHRALDPLLEAARRVNSTHCSTMTVSNRANAFDALQKELESWLK